MIGNDIVDLSLAKEQSNWQRKGFLKKLFSDAELDLISDSKEADLLVWLLWSMKESAYKADFRISKRRKFNPTKFECDLVNELNGKVYYQGNMYKTKTLIENNFVHTSAWQLGSDINISGPIIETFDSQFTSNELYQSLLLNVSLITARKKKDLCVIKSPTGIPEIYEGQIKLKTLCSISHHGRYGAFIINN